MQYLLKSPKSGTVYTVDTPRERVQLLSAGYIEVTEQQQSTPKRDSRPGTKSSQPVTPPQPAPPTEDEPA